MTFGIQQNCLNNETGILPGCKFSNRSYSGDVASLNHRRMAFVLPGHEQCKKRANPLCVKIVTGVE